MQCKCCEYDVKDNAVRCPVCGFPTNSSSPVGVDELAQKYRRQRLDGISIAVKIRYYEQNNNGDLTEKNSEYKVLAEASALRLHEVTWLNAEFNPPRINRAVALEIKLIYPDNSVETSVQVETNKSLTCSRLGLCLDEGLAFRFAVGNKSDYILSRPTQLLTQKD